MLLSDIWSLPEAERQKRPPSTKGPVTGTFGTKVLKLLRCHPNWRFQTARSAARRHAPFLGNGGKARRRLLGQTVQPALCGPFRKAVPAAIPPPAALLKVPALPTLPLHRFNAMNLSTVYLSRRRLSSTPGSFLTFAQFLQSFSRSIPVVFHNPHIKITKLHSGTDHIHLKQTGYWAVIHHRYRPIQSFWR